jgi:hypothetical protein
MEPVINETTAPAAQKGRQCFMSVNENTEIVPIEPEELVEELRRLRERIPNYGQLTIRQAQSMVRVAHLPVQFVQAGLSAAGGYSGTKTLTGWTGDELRQQQEEAARWTAVEDELTVMLQGVGAANLKRRHVIGQAVLQIYTVMRGLVKQKEHSDLIPFVEMMKQTNHIRGKSKKKAAIEEETESPAASRSDVEG